MVVKRTLSKDNNNNYVYTLQGYEENQKVEGVVAQVYQYDHSKKYKIDFDGCINGDLEFVEGYVKVIKMGFALLRRLNNFSNK